MIHLVEHLGAALPIVMLVGGLALFIAAGYLQYVALPQEHTPRHVVTRATLAIVGVVLVLLGDGFLR